MDENIQKEIPTEEPPVQEIPTEEPPLKEAHQKGKSARQVPPAQQFMPPMQNMQQSAPAMTYQPIIPPKQRRVGTFTLGLTLILIGVIIPMTMIFKDKALFILQFAPVVLVILGIEVLCFAFGHKEGKLKYDGFSIFLVIMLTIVSIAAASIVPVVTTYMENARIVNSERVTADRAVSDAMDENEIVGNSYSYDNGRFDDYGNYIWYEKYTQDWVKLSGNITISWDDSFGEKIPTKQEISRKIEPFLEAIEYPFESVSLNVEYNGMTIAQMSLDDNDIQKGNFKLRYMETAIKVLKEKLESIDTEAMVSSEVAPLEAVG